MQCFGRSRRIQELAGGLIVRRTAMSSSASTGYVTAATSGLISPLGGSISRLLLEKDPAAHPEPMTRFTTCRKTQVHASFQDIQVLEKAYRLFIASPTRFPGRWKQLPRYNHLMPAFRLGPVCVALWNGELLLLLTSPGVFSPCLLYSFRTSSWFDCHKPPYLLPDTSSSAAWFQDSFYMGCSLASADEVEEVTWLAHRESYPMSETDDEKEHDEEGEKPQVFSIMRFDPSERRWYQLDLSDKDVERLSSGLSVPLVVRGRLLVFTAAWGYLQAPYLMEQCYVGRKQARLSWDGRSNPIKVFELEDDPACEGWSKAGESERKNMKRLVEVTGEFSNLVDAAWKQNAGRFFTGGDDDQVLNWVTSKATLVRYDVSRDQLLGSPRKFYVAEEGRAYGSRTTLSKGLFMVHREPCGEDSIFSMFDGLPEINDSTSDEEVKKAVPGAKFRAREPVQEAV